MSTEFFWDEDLKKRIFTRYGSGCVDADADLRYCFESVEDCVSFLTAGDRKIIYSEYGVPYTVASLRLEIINRGVIYFDQVTE